jgi:hypothetical protein
MKTITEELISIGWKKDKNGTNGNSNYFKQKMIKESK